MSQSFQSFLGSLLKVEDISGIAVLVLPLGFSLGVMVNVIILWIAFEKKFRGFTCETGRAIFEGISSSLITGFVAYLGLNIFAPFFNTETLIGIFLQGFFAGILGIIAGTITLILLKSRELKEVWGALQHRFWKTRVIATEKEIV